MVPIFRCMNAKELLENLLSLEGARTQDGRLVATSRQLWLVKSYWPSIDATSSGQGRANRARKLQERLSSLFFCNSFGGHRESLLPMALPLRLAASEVRDAINRLEESFVSPPSPR